MRNIFPIMVVFCMLSFIIPTQLHAVVDPLSVPNNTFGIHIIDEHDLEDAARLVNGNGGKWGYVTVVVSEQNRDTGRWQRIFDNMRSLHLIPVVRIATQPEGDTWKKPVEDDAKKWIDFFDSLNWVVQNRYIILFNEPNHAKEWGGTIDPEDYVRVAKAFRDRLKESSDDYFILPAGIDLAAGNGNGTMDAANFFDRMYKEDPQIFTRFDGWTSHSYPNPAFSGSVYARGKLSIRGYEWERNYLSSYGLPRSIPIFITETGWVLNESHSTSDIADFYETAFTSVWTDPSIVMVSPFILNYQGAPFDHFSWKKLGSSDFYDHYHRVLALKKKSGSPQQINSFTVSPEKIPNRLTINSFYMLPVVIKNTGQQIWDDTTDLDIQLVGAVGDNKPTKRPVPHIEPMHMAIVHIPFKTPDIDTSVPVIVAVTTGNGDIVGDVVSKTITVREPPSFWEQFMSYISSEEIQ